MVDLGTRLRRRCRAVRVCGGGEKIPACPTYASSLRLYQARETTLLLLIIDIELSGKSD